MPKDTLVELSRVTKSYRAGEITIDVLRGVDLILRRDELVVVHGVSGCGKTTLLNLIGALDVPSSGDVPLDGAHHSATNRPAPAPAPPANLLRPPATIAPAHPRLAEHNAVIPR